MRELAERAYFLLCLALGRLLRSGRYRRLGSSTRTASVRCESAACSTRPFWSGWVVRWSGSWILAAGPSPAGLGGTGAPDLRSLYDASIRIDADGTLVLPWLAGETLATLLEDPKLEVGP